MLLFEELLGIHIDLDKPGLLGSHMLETETVLSTGFRLPLDTRSEKQSSVAKPHTVVPLTGPCGKMEGTRPWDRAQAPASLHPPASTQLGQQ